MVNSLGGGSNRVLNSSVYKNKREHNVVYITTTGEIRKKKKKKTRNEVCLTELPRASTLFIYFNVQN